MTSDADEVSRASDSYTFGTAVDGAVNPGSKVFNYPAHELTLIPYFLLNYRYGRG